MKKYLYIFAFLSFALTGCYDNLSEQTHTDLENLKSGKVATVQQQVANITTTIGTLQTMSDELEKYISQLQNVKSGLDADYANLNQALNSLKADIQDEMDEAEAKMLSEYEVAGNALKKKISEINNTLNVLIEKKESMNNLLDSLRKNLDENYATADWVKTTLATLESQNKMVSEVSEIKAHVDELSKSLVETERAITELLEGRLAELNTNLGGKFQSEIAALDKGYKDAIAKASADITAALDEALKDTISECFDKLKGWVNEQLDGYFTIAEAKSKLLAFQTLVGNVPEGENIQNEIESLVAAYNKAMEEITVAYVSAITAAIEKSDSDMDGYIAEQIKKVNDDLEALSLRAGAIEEEVIKLQNKFSELQSRINSIDEQISAINTSLAVLSELKMTLDEYIESVFNRIKEDYDTHYNEIKSLIEALQAEAGSIQTQINDLQNYIGEFPSGDNLIDWIKSTEQTIRLQFEAYCTIERIEEIKLSLEKEIQIQEGDIAEYESTLSSLIDNARSTIDGWIDEQLTGYHTAAEIDGMLVELKSKLKGLVGSGDSEIQKQLEDLQDEYEKAVEYFINEYTAAVAKAIEDNQGKIDDVFADAIDDANGKIEALTDRATTIKEHIEIIRAALDQIKKDIEVLSSDVSFIQEFIKDSEYNSLQAFVDYVNGVLEECKTKYATIDQYKTLYDIIYGTETEKGLKYWVDQMTDLTERLEKAETASDKLEAFFDGFDFEKETLVSILDAINKDLKDLKDEVFGVEGEKEGLQDMIDEILTKLYGGPDKTKETATDESIYKQLEVLKKKVIAATFASISYIPENESGTVSAGSFTLRFFVCPAELVTLLDKDNCKLINGAISNVSGNADTGILTVTASASSGQWVALDVDIRLDEEEDGDKVEFMSQYIKVK